MYHLIKAADPAAQIFAGTIVQPTELRLQYLDMILASYRQQFGEPMPVDGWSIHAFILNEVSCAYDPGNCWGAEIPPGIDAPYGEVLTIEDNDRIDLFIERIERFRYWMKDRGYANKPLYLTEYGILMPPDYGFGADRVNAFMNKTFDYLSTARQSGLGYAPDGDRLVQRWSWFSTATTSSNGWLFDPVTLQLTEIGQNFAAYTGNVPRVTDFFPVSLSSSPSSPFSLGTPVNLELHATIANDGNQQLPTGPVLVQFYNGDPAQGGTLIGQVNTEPLAGCGSTNTVSVSWEGVQPGVYQVFVVVDSGNIIAEDDENNNIQSFIVLLSTNQSYLPNNAR
ncbi:MAG: CARDB domain-containing protein [Chloroflexota bacterium]